MKLSPIRVFWIFAFALILAIRIHLCAQAPIESSDLFRNLGYTSHLGDSGLSLYDTVATHFVPEFWTQFWPTQGFLYPPATLLFFSFFSALGLGLFWVKLTLTLLDLLMSFVIAESLGAFAGLLLLSAPVSIWYASHEGQFDGLLALMIILTIFFLKKSRWFWAGVFWMLALNSKQFGILLAPFILAEFLRTPKESRLVFVRNFGLGLFVGFTPLAPFYFHAPELWFKPFATQGFVYNPFYWNIFAKAHFSWNPPLLVGWNAIWTWLSAALAFVFLIRQCCLMKTRFKDAIIHIFESAPLLTFWALLKNLNWAQFWYTMSVPAFVFCLHRYKRIVIVLLLIHWLQCGRSLVLLTSRNFGLQEYPQTIAHFQNCLWTCNYQAANANL